MMHAIQMCLMVLVTVFFMSVIKFALGTLAPTQKGFLKVMLSLVLIIMNTLPVFVL
jgi:hypothetical protein